MPECYQKAYNGHKDKKNFRTFVSVKRFLEKNVRIYPGEARRTGAPPTPSSKPAGVGYLLHISLQTYSEIEGRSEVKLFTHFVVREDAQLFFGFSTKTERELFRQLISVSGVGGNTARMILSTYSPRELQSIITTENAVLLKNVKGLGLKTAQKIIVELSGKLTALFDGDAGPLPVAATATPSTTKRRRPW